MKTVIRDIWRLLTFRAIAEEMENWDRRHLIAGIIGTWLAGIGRYWDHPNPELFQLLGLGSLAYILVLSLLIFLIVWPLRPSGWHPGAVLIFVSLTSFPAILYATPVERFMPTPVAAQMNVWFLIIVATWRVALLFFFLSRYAQLGVWRALISILFLVGGIVVILAILNLEKAVFDIMAGVRDVTAYDRAYEFVFNLAMLAYISAVPILIAYVATIGLVAWNRWRG